MVREELTGRIIGAAIEEGQNHGPSLNFTKPQLAIRRVHDFRL